MLKLILSVAFIVFCVCPAYSVTTISSLPYTARTAGETYQLNSDLTLNTGTAITIGANNVTIDCQNHTLKFAQTGGGTGIDVGGYGDVEVRNCNFSTAYTRSDGSYIRAIRLSSAASPYIHHNTFNVVGRACGSTYDRERGIDGGTSTSGTISNNTFRQSGIDRGISINVREGQWNISNNTFTCTACTITSSYGFFIRLSEYSTAGATIADNTFSVDANSTHFYPINGWDAQNVNILRNKFTFSGTHGRIINPDNASSGWTIRDNTITVNGSGSGNIYAIRYRNANASGGDCGGNHTIEYNTIDCSGYKGTGTCNAISIGGYGDSTNACYNTDIRYNYLKGKSGTFAFYQSSPVGSVNAIDQDIYCNKIESTTGSPISIPSASGELRDIKFAYNLITPPSGRAAVSTSVAWGSNVTFCGSGTISTSGGSVGYESSCNNGSTGCYATAGARTSGDSGSASLSSPTGLRIVQ